MSKQGDKGFTLGECNLIVSKDSPFVEAVGSIDRFQSRLGWTRVALQKKEDKKIILQIEKDLGEIMGNLYQKTEWKNGKKRIQEIEHDSEIYKSKVKDLNNFLIPGENEIESRINICRADCREAERRIVTLGSNENIIKYFNKTSAFLNWMWRSKLIKK